MTEDKLRFDIRYTHGATGDRRTYGSASDRSGADALVASLKIQPCSARDIAVIDTLRTVACKSCEAPIIWLRTRNGKNCPCDAASVGDDDEIFDVKKHISHFATCPHAAQHRRPKND